MPIWAYIYCGFIVLSSLFCIVSEDRLRKVYQPAGEIFDSICGIIVFLIAFNVIEFEHNKLVSTGAFALSFAWSCHAHRQFLDYQSFKDDLHRSDQELDAELIKEYGEAYEPTYSYEDTEKKAKMWFAGVLLFVVLALSPYLYAYFLSLGFSGH